MPLQPPANDVAIIRSLRADSNAGLAARDAARVTAAFATDIHSIAGSGGLTDGREAVTKIYTEELALGGVFLSGERLSQRIAVDADGTRASEPGRWRWTVRAAGGEASYRGDYLAGWVKRDGRWKLQSELYVTTGCSGPGCST